LTGGVGEIIDKREEERGLTPSVTFGASLGEGGCFVFGDL